MKLTVTVVTFTVGDETFYSQWWNLHTHRTVPVSFITDCKSYATNCKSDDSTCKFHQLLQLVTITRTTIQLTITRGGSDWNQTEYAPGGDWKQKILISYASPPGAYWVGATENVSPVSFGCQSSHSLRTSDLVWDNQNLLLGDVPSYMYENHRMGFVVPHNVMVFMNRLQTVRSLHFWGNFYQFIPQIEPL